MADHEQLREELDKVIKALNKIDEEISREIQELQPRRRPHLRLIPGGAAAIAGILSAGRWLRKHPGSSAAVGLAAAAGFVGGVYASTPANDISPPDRPPVALPAPPANQPPAPSRRPPMPAPVLPIVTLPAATSTPTTTTIQAAAASITLAPSETATSTASEPTTTGSPTETSSSPGTSMPPPTGRACLIQVDVPDLVWLCALG